MQIRIANRQDEPEIRTFVESIYKESGSSLELENKDSDLRNIEANYFGKEGLILVAEHENKIVGLAGARKKTESVLEIKRLIGSSSDAFKENEMLDEMLTVIVDFASRLLYESVHAPDHLNKSVLVKKGFSVTDGQTYSSVDITRDF